MFLITLNIIILITRFACIKPPMLVQDMKLHFKRCRCDAVNISKQKAQKYLCCN